MVGVSQDGDNGIAFMNMVMNILFQRMGSEFIDYMRK